VPLPSRTSYLASYQTHFTFPHPTRVTAAPACKSKAPPARNTDNTAPRLGLAPRTTLHKPQAAKRPISLLDVLPSAGRCTLTHVSAQAPQHSSAMTSSSRSYCTSRILQSKYTEESPFETPQHGSGAFQALLMARGIASAAVCFASWPLVRR
jgi:hypothetical protein